VGGIQRGSLSEEVTFYDRIGFGTTAAQTQGFKPTDLTTPDGGAAYSEALDLLANQDEFDINLIMLPGIIHNLHTPITNKAIDICEDRGDCFAIIDPIIKGKNVGDATTEAEKVDSNFAGMYWPWVQISDSQVAGTMRWVPPSVVLGGIYAFNDKVAHPWFAPAGLNRGGITSAIQAERKLTQGERDTLYDSNINPIATFPGQGVTVFGQKTLQKKSSALDRINVRRLLIRVKKFIASSSRFLVFEQNTAATRRRFLGIVNPFLENVQSQSGLNAFRVVMDETNNTPDTIDRNQLIGQLFLQPTRTAEFIVLDFTVQPTGAAFPE
jgi:phage tail sheath protein FI